MLYNTHQIYSLVSNKNFQTLFPLQKIKHLATPVLQSLDWLNLCLQAVRFNLELAAPSGTSICALENAPRWESNWVGSAFQNCSSLRFYVNNLHLNLKRKSGLCQCQLPIESCPKICTMICPMICDCSYILVTKVFIVI